MTTTTWSITDHAYRLADLGDRHYDPDRAEFDQPCGDCGEEWTWHATSDGVAAA